MEKWILENYFDNNSNSFRQKFDLEQEQEAIKSYRERIRQAERSGEFALSEALRDIIKEEQDHEIDLRDALGLR